LILNANLIDRESHILALELLDVEKKDRNTSELKAGT
jgi:hypothetical protein